MSMVRFWNLTASHPAVTAAAISFLASPRSPLWLIPISATTKLGPSWPICRPAISTALVISAPPVRHVVGARSKLRVGITGSDAQTDFAERSQIIHVIPDEGGVRGGECSLSKHRAHRGSLVGAVLHRFDAELLGAGGNHRIAFS